MIRLPWLSGPPRSSAFGFGVNAIFKVPPSRRSLATNTKFFNISDEVRQAVSERRPVVALESTIYTHGFPYPDNLALASRLESLVRINGAVPATIGVLDGIVRVGMEPEALIRLVASSGKPNTLKLSRRDLSFALGKTGVDGKPFNGGTTVSATALLAHKAGIRVFATGGLGGVHRGAEQTMDVSADLPELGRTPVAVISSGCKSFLDIPKTLEYLETQGVAVATFTDGRNGAVDFPAFYSRDSGVKSPITLPDEVEAARVINAHLSLGLQSGLLLASPIPSEQEIPFAEMEGAIAKALKKAADAGATGAASTPYILAKIKEITGSRSMMANKALVESNVVRGAKVAVELRRLQVETGNETNRASQPKKTVVGPGASNYTSAGVLSLGVSSATTQAHNTDEVSSPTPQDDQADIFVAGALNVDFSCDFAPPPGSTINTPDLHTSNPATISQSLGGVGHNVALAAHLLGAKVRLCSAIADDLSGQTALNALTSTGMSTASIQTLPSDPDTRTSQYVAINDKTKDLLLAMADTSILEQTSLTTTFHDTWLPQLQASNPTHLLLDANWPAPHLSRWLHAATQQNTHITFEPVSTTKATHIFHLTPPLQTYPHPTLHLSTPNTHELTAMHAAARETAHLARQDWWAVIDALGIPSSGARTQLALATSNDLVDQGIPQQSIQLLPFIPTLCTKLGAQGVLLTQILPANDPRLSSADYAPYILSRCNNGTEATLGVGGVYMRLFPPAEAVQGSEVVSVNGVGDTFAGTLVAGLAKGGGKARVEELVDVAQRAAVLTLRSRESVSPGLGTLKMLL
ncbi:IdgA domain-containing protein [Teratosphaeria nubilosa]|uniref:IdgA domain-containing protein n=1 Tax=Teratosphaeria nubilosa TaxID=161662 RepID=A0A6G1LJA5_9PEZI|nr:IdgA domain-containing protein [Teratosphaeria nubilosa]